MNTLRNFAKFAFALISRNLNISRKNKSMESPDHVLYNDICSYFESLRFFGHPFRENLLIES